MHAKSLQLYPTLFDPWTVVSQTLLSMGFCRQEYWSELPYPPPADFLTQGSNLRLRHCRQILYHWGSPIYKHVCMKNYIKLIFLFKYTFIYAI